MAQIKIILWTCVLFVYIFTL